MRIPCPKKYVRCTIITTLLFLVLAYITPAQDGILLETQRPFSPSVRTIRSTPSVFLSAANDTLKIMQDRDFGLEREEDIIDRRGLVLELVEQIQRHDQDNERRHSASYWISLCEAAHAVDDLTVELDVLDFDTDIRLRLIDQFTLFWRGVQYTGMCPDAIRPRGENRADVTRKYIADHRKFSQQLTQVSATVSGPSFLQLFEAAWNKSDNESCAVDVGPLSRLVLRHCNKGSTHMGSISGAASRRPDTLVCSTTDLARNACESGGGHVGMV
eukprot:m.54882 g.54882  ORF g.54882 m.54882 type:complete len:272 (-) comp15530_c1_seq3:1215-2030(-)